MSLAEQTSASLQETEAESRRLALVASHTASSVMLTDPKWRIDWVNASFTRFFGYTLEEARGLRPSEILHGVDTDLATLAAINEASDQAIPFKGEILNYTKDRQPRWVELEIQPLKDEQGNGHGVHGAAARHHRA